MQSSEDLFFFLFSKRTLLLNNLPALLGSMMMFFSYHAKAPSLLITGRLIVGFNSGKVIFCCLQYLPLAWYTVGIWT